MINTRGTIFKTLKKRLRELTKHALLAPLQFKKIMLAVILNDLKEWSEYIPNNDTDQIVDLLNTLLLNNCFIIDRIPTDNFAYKNVNTPQTNTTWQRIWDKNCSKYCSDPKYILPTEYTWQVDPTCEVQMIYFYKSDTDLTALDYLYRIYGEHGEKLKTVCEKMDVYIDRETGNGYYLDTTGEWKSIGTGDGVTEDDVNRLINSRNITHSTEENSIKASLTTDTNYDNIQLATTEDIII